MNKYNKLIQNKQQVYYYYFVAGLLHWPSKKVSPGYTSSMAMQLGLQCSCCRQA